MSDFEQLKPCPFCGGRAELDTQRGFLAFPNGKIENQVSIYCAGDDPCLADMSICYSDHPDIHPDVVVRWAIDQWNTRAAKQSMQGEAVAEIYYASKHGEEDGIEIYGGRGTLPKGTKLYTHAPDSAKTIAEFQAENEALRKDADAFRKMVRHNMQLVVTQKSDSLSLGVTDAKSTASGTGWHTASHIKDDAFEATRTAINRCADAAIKGGE